MRRTVLFAVVLILLTPVTLAQEDITAPWPTDAWETATPESQGFDSLALAEIINIAIDEDVTIHSLTVIRNGYVVLDAARYPYTVDHPHILHSVTKSFISTLIGITIDDGLIDSVHVPVFDFFPQYDVTEFDERTASMTVEDLLTMRTGLACDNNPPTATFVRMIETDDWVDFTLNLLPLHTPGSEFSYCNPASHLLSAILTQATGMSTLEYAEQKLFDPLGIEPGAWLTDPQGIYTGYADLWLKPHDMAKLGYLYINNGVWDGQQIVSAEWITAATTPHVDFGNDGDARPPAVLGEDVGADGGYGYQWWTYFDGGAYAAQGSYGQSIVVTPAADTVVVITGSLPQSDAMATFFGIMEMVAGTMYAGTLPENPDGAATLQAALERFAAPPDPQPVEAPPESYFAIEDVTFAMDTLNPLGERVTFSFDAEPADTMRITVEQGSQVLDWVVGLDGVYRINETSSGSLALRGQWTGFTRFSIDYYPLGGSLDVRFIADFGDPQTLELTLLDRATPSSGRYTGSRTEG